MWLLLTRSGLAAPQPGDYLVRWFSTADGSVINTTKTACQANRQASPSKAAPVCTNIALSAPSFTTDVAAQLVREPMSTVPQEALP